MSVEVDNPADLVEYPDPKVRRIGRRRADPFDPLTSAALSRPTGHVATVRGGASLDGESNEGVKDPNYLGYPGNRLSP